MSRALRLLFFDRMPTRPPQADGWMQLVGGAFFMALGLSIILAPQHHLADVGEFGIVAVGAAGLWSGFVSLAQAMPQLARGMGQRSRISRWILARAAASSQERRALLFLTAFGTSMLLRGLAAFADRRPFFTYGVGDQLVIGTLGLALAMRMFMVLRSRQRTTRHPIDSRA